VGISEFVRDRDGKTIREGDTMTFTVEKMYRLPDAGSLLAFADVSIDDAIVIRGVRLLRGKKGIFMSMPQEQGKDNKWYDQVVCKNASVYEGIACAVLRAYGHPDTERITADAWENLQ
jgi:DNA-binding cell septation regulator SpoVG